MAHKKKGLRSSTTPLDVDGILRKSDENRAAAAQRQPRDPYEPPWGWGYPGVSRRETTATAAPVPAPRVGGAPHNPCISSRDRKATKAKRRADSKKKASVKTKP